MAFQILPARRTGGQEFSEAFSPYLQYAFQEIMKKKLAEQQNKKNIELAKQMGLITETQPGLQDYQQQIQGQGGGMYVSPDLSPTEQFATAQKLFKGAGVKPPQPTYALNQLPGMKTSMKFEGGVPSFGVETKEPNYIDEYYKSLIGGEKEVGIPSAEEAKKQFIQQNPQYIENDILSEPEYTTYKGMTRQVGWKPKLNQKAYEERTLKETQSQMVKEKAQGTLDTLENVKEGIAEGYFGTRSYIPTVRGTQRFDWQQSLNKVLSEKIIEVMTEMKRASKTGATGFGQLNIKELEVLQNASNELKEGTSPQRASELIAIIEDKLNRIVSGQSSTQSPNEDLSQMSDDELRAIASGGQ